MRALISGAGIAGPTLAWWLRRRGHEVTIVERAPAPRSGGYVIDFWGAGFDITERMGLLPEVRRDAYLVDEVRLVDDDGRRAGGFAADVFRRLSDGRFVSLPRSGLAAILLHALDGGVEILYGDTIAELHDDGAGVDVRFEKAPSRRFDVVIGADGLHSRVRALAFGPEADFESYLGYSVAAFQVEGYRPRDELVYVMYTEVGRQVGRFTMRDDRTMFVFIWREDAAAAHVSDPAAQRQRLHERFAGAGWETPRILAELDRVDSLYFDRVSQIRMPAWSRGRVGLVGDAAYCPSFLAGQGSALAMVGAYVLAAELRDDVDPAEALRRYHAYLARFLDEKQRAALRLASTFVPRSRAGLWLRNRLSGLLSVGWIGRLAARRGLLDRIELPPFDDATPPPGRAAAR